MSGATLRAVVIVLATTAAAATARSDGSSPPRFQNRQVCWDSFCADPSSTVHTPQTQQKTVTPTTKARKQAPKPAPATSARTPPSKVPVPPKQILSKATATGGAFYRYPIIYRAEAPPPMPPGTSEQPYVQATQGVWYWPGADSIKVPVVAGFDPAM